MRYNGMISTLLYFFLKVALVVILLVAMVFVLFGIGHLYRGEGAEEKAETKKLREEVENSPHVVSRHSLFNSFLVKAISRNKT